VALPINSEEVERLAYEIAAYTGESVPDAIRNALRERLDRQKARGNARVFLAPAVAGDPQAMRSASEARPANGGRDPWIRFCRTFPADGPSIPQHSLPY